MKIFERIIDNSFREIVEITVNQAGFVKNCGTTDAIHAARFFVEKQREKNRSLYIKFLDLEKAFDRAPHGLVCSTTTLSARRCAGFNCSTTIRKVKFEVWRVYQNRFVPLLVFIKKAPSHHSHLLSNKTEFLTTDPHETGTITISGSDLPRRERFKCFGSILSANGETRYEIISRINATWMK